MSRMMKGSTIILSLLAIALVISVHGVISERATKTEVTGELDLSAPLIIDPGESWVDDEGNTHTKNQILEGTGTLIIGQDAIDIRIRLSINGVVDPEGNGNSHGWFIDFIGDAGDEPTDDNTIFEGMWNGGEVEFIFAGKFQGQGRGTYAGTKLKGTSQEEGGDSSIFSLDGSLLDPHGE